MPQQSIMEQADLIMGGVLSNPSKASTVGSLGVSQEELPDVSPEQHEALMSHVLGEGKIRDTVKKVVRKVVKFGKKVMTPSTPEELKAMGMQDRNAYLAGKDVNPLPKPKKFKADKSGTVRNADRYGEGEVKKMKNENLTQSQMDILIQAKNIVAEMTSVGMVGTNMASNSSKTSHHPALLVKLPGDKDQAVQIKAASTPPVFKATVAKDPAPSGTKKTRVIVKRKSAHSKDDETQGRIHNDMKAMYHESFSNFVGELLTENIKESI